VALLLTSLLAGRQLSHWPAKLRYRGEQNCVEGMRLVEMVHLREGVPIYAPPSPDRFDASIYGPLYYLLGARLIDPDDPAYLPLRVVSLIATLGCAAGVSLLAYWLARKRTAALLAPLIFLSYSVVTMHGLSSRCDMVAVCLFLWGFLTASRHRNSSRILWAAPLMLTGLFYKQQFVAGPMAVTLFLILERRYKLAAAFAGLMGGGAAVSLAVLQFWIFRGQDFFLHAFLLNLLPLSLVQFQAGVLAFGLVFLVPFLVALEALRVRSEKLVFLYVLIAGFLALAALGKVGSDSNYYLELICLLSALFATTFVDRLGDRLAAVELLVLLVFALFMGQFLALPNPSPSDFERDDAIQTYLRRNFAPGGAALSYYAGDMIRAGLDSPISDIYQYSKLIRMGTLSDRYLINALEKKRFKLIALTCNLEIGAPEPPCVRHYLTPEIAESIVRNYHVHQILDLPPLEALGPEQHFFAWVPKPDPEHPAEAH